MEKMSFYVYILHCSDDSYYTGHTENLEARIEAHRQGIFSGYTASRPPVQLVFLQRSLFKAGGLRTGATDQGLEKAQEGSFD